MFADEEKWHCYLCKPKKISKLQDECKKILDYIEKEDKKEKERIERAKQREKEKAESAKKEKEEKARIKAEKEEKQKDEKEEGKDDKLVVKTDVKKEKLETPKRGLPVPMQKEKLAAALKIEDKLKDARQNVAQSDLIIVDNIEEVKNKIPHYQHHRAVHYRPDADTGVEKVVKGQSNVLEVTVGPKKPMPVQAPYKDNNFQDVPYKNQPKPIMNALPIIMPKIQVSGTKAKKVEVGFNEISAMKRAIHSYNVESFAEKLQTATQCFGLSLNAVKTDLAIAALSNANLVQARNLAVNQMVNNLESYFNTLRCIFNVRIEAKSHSSVNDTVTPKLLEALAGAEPAKPTETIVLDDDGAKKDKNSKDTSCVVISDSEDKSKEKIDKKSVAGDCVVEINDDSKKSENNSTDKAKKKSDEKIEEQEEEPMETETEKESEKDSNPDMNVSENTAAKLELLKEMEDELEDEQDSVSESKKLRRSSRTSSAADEKVEENRSKHSSVPNPRQKSSKKDKSSASDLTESETEKSSMDTDSVKKGKEKDGRKTRQGLASSEKKTGGNKGDPDESDGTEETVVDDVNTSESKEADAASKDDKGVNNKKSKGKKKQISQKEKKLPEESGSDTEDTKESTKTEEVPTTKITLKIKKADIKKGSSLVESGSDTELEPPDAVNNGVDNSDDDSDSESDDFEETHKRKRKTRSAKKEKSGMLLSEFIIFSVKILIFTLYNQYK